MASANDIADYLISLASKEDEYEPMTHLRLQKLLYYVQGWSLAVRGNPAFRDEIQAWKDGPVVPDVFQRFTHLKREPIKNAKRDQSRPLGAETEAFVRSIWEAYKAYSATALRSKTHRETPWVEARGGTPDGGRSQEEITHEAMIDYFRREFESSQFGHLSIDRYRESEHAFRSRKGKRFADIRSMQT